MAFDALLKKYFSIVLLGLVALMAALQASGVMKLFGASLGADEKTLTQAPKAPTALPTGAPQDTKVRTGDAILGRNPFDSVTGPLNAKPIDSASLATAPADLSNPLAAPTCDGIKVAIITESDDPTWSIAALQGPQDQRPTIRRVGDKVGSQDVVYIGYNPVQASPAVWLNNSGSLCQLVLFAPQPTVKPVASASAGPPAPPGSGGPAAVPGDIASKIQKISETEFAVDRSVVDKILENQAELMRSARIVPEQQGGKVVGIRLFGIRPDTLLGTLGFQNGDRLESINGFNMASPEKALEAYARLRTASNLEVKVTRRGSPMSIDFRIK